jgi:DNA polymerase III delta subunit
MGLHPFVVDKAAQQADRFRDDELPLLLEALLDADVAIKSGTMEPDAALDVMVATMCGAGGRKTTDGQRSMMNRASD